MEKYIIIAHPIDFVYKALAGFLQEEHGVRCYRLESEDDVDFRIQDLRPIVLIVHTSFNHDSLETENLIDKFLPEIPVVAINSDKAGVIQLKEPFNPAEAAQFILNSLEPKQ